MLKELGELGKVVTLECTRDQAEAESGTAARVARGTVSGDGAESRRSWVNEAGGAAALVGEESYQRRQLPGPA